MLAVAVTSPLDAPKAALKVMPALVLIVLGAVFAVLNHNFYSAENIQNIVLASSVLLTIASASTFVILLGCIDLSVGAIASMSGMVAALLVPDLGTAAVLVSVAIGAAIGLVNGVLHVGLRIPSFLVTLGTMTSLSGAIMLLTNGGPVPILDRNFVNLANGALIPSVPNIGLWAVATYLALVLVDRRSLFGRHILAIGGSERIASLIGIHVGRCKIQAFALSGAAAGLAGALLAARLQTAAVAMGDGLNLQAIATIIIGGTFITGGTGSVARTLVGVLVIVVLANGLDLMGVHPYLQTVIKSLVVLVAVIVMNDRRVSILK
jgi:ribose/xylose/arabinose/galactoside ABC-type transport system permease subunit